MLETSMIRTFQTLRNTRFQNEREMRRYEFKDNRKIYW